MRGISGVTGAAPVMHAILEHLHERFGTSWYAPPASLVEHTVHRLTGRLVGADVADAVREKFVDGALPAPEQPRDYDAMGRVRLPPEYAAWIATNGHHPGTGLVLAPASAPTTAFDERPANDIRLRQPLPASVYVLDPDLPEAGGWLPLIAQGRGEVTWASPTLAIEVREGRPGARLSEGRHELVARDATTGAEARTWIQVRRL